MDGRLGAKPISLCVLLQINQWNLNIWIGCIPYTVADRLEGQFYSVAFLIYPNNPFFILPISMAHHLVNHVCNLIFWLVGASLKIPIHFYYGFMWKVRWTLCHCVCSENVYEQAHPAGPVMNAMLLLKRSPHWVLPLLWMGEHSQFRAFVRLFGDCSSVYLVVGVLADPSNWSCHWSILLHISAFDRRIFLFVFFFWVKCLLFASLCLPTASEWKARV